MNKHTRTKAVRKSSRTNSSNNNNVPDFDHLAEVAASQVEHRTVLEFLRLIPHKWHPDEIGRFGDKVKRMAEALQLAFVPSVNPKLGVIRTYPVPLMQWVYTMLAAQFGWPAPALALEDGAREQREELRRTEGAKKHLETAAGHAPTPEIAEAIKKVLNWLDCESARLQAAPEGEGAPLRVV